MYRIDLIPISIFILLLGGLFWVVRESDKQAEAFMTACEADHKHYECQAMLRGSGSHVVPMPIVVHR